MHDSTTKIYGNQRVVRRAGRSDRTDSVLWAAHSGRMPPKGVSPSNKIGWVEAGAARRDRTRWASRNAADGFEMASRKRRLIWQLISFALFFGLWELLGRWPISFAFPPFSATLRAFLSMTFDGSLPKAYLSTLQPLIIGIVLCGVAGIGFGIGMGLSRAVEWFSLPMMSGR